MRSLLQSMEGLMSQAKKNDNPLEKVIESKVCEYARKQGILTYKFTSPSNRGVFDRIWVFHKNVMFVEFKRKNGKLSGLQSKFMDDMNKHEIPTFVINDIEFGKHVVDSIVQQVTPTPSSIILPNKKTEKINDRTW